MTKKEELSLSEERKDSLNISQERADQLKDKVISIAEENKAEDAIKKVVQESAGNPLNEAITMQSYIKQIYKDEFLQKILHLDVWNNWYEQNEQELEELLRTLENTSKWSS